MLTYFSLASVFLTGKYRSEADFGKSVRGGHMGKYLMPRVMFARFYGVITQDRPLFEKTLKDVIAAPHDLWPEQRLPNELAKRRAARYLAHADDYF